MAQSDLETMPDLGVLVGWIARPAGDRIVITMQSAKTVPDGPDDVDEKRYFLSKEQAVLLGNTLYELAGATPPRRSKPDLIERIFARG